MGINPGPPCCGVILGAMILGIVCVAIISRVKERDRHRRRSNYCCRCGYNVTTNRVCPECGEENANFDEGFWSQR